MSYGKLLGLVIGLTTVISLVVGCGGAPTAAPVSKAPAALATPPPSATPEPTATPEPAATPEPTATPPDARATLAKTPSLLEEALAGKYKGKSVSMGSIFGGPFESAYVQSLTDFEEKTGINVNYQQVSDDVLSTIEADKGPDIVYFDYLSPAKALAKEGKVIDLNKWLDRATLQNQYPENWLNWATMDGQHGPIMAGLWGLYPLKGLVWYPKAAFEKAGYQVPTSWAEMLALSDQIVKDGATPWCIENAGDDPSHPGYPAGQWVGDILLRTAPPEDYDKWINGDLRFTSPQVKHAVQLMGDLFFKPGYTLGGRQAINGMTMYEASQAIFATPPKCWLIKEPGEIVDWDGVSDYTIFDSKVFGQDYAFFVLPPIDPAYGAPVEMQAFFYTVFHDRPEVRALVEYLASGADVEAWIKQGNHFGVSPHQNARLDWYPHERERAVAALGMAAQQAGTLHYVASEAMWPAVNSQFYKSISDYIAGTVDLDTALRQIDAAGPAAAPTEQTTKSNKVLMVPREVSDDMEYMLTKEVAVMKSMLEKAGFQVVVATASGKPLVGTTTTVTADLKLSNVNVEDYAGFILPCMAAGDTGIIPPDTVTFAQKAMATGKPMAAQQSATQILDRAGVLKGKHYASQDEFPDGVYMGTGVVQDGNLITSGVCPNMARNAGLPDGTVELTQKFIAALGSAQ